MKLVFARIAFVALASLLNAVHAENYPAAPIRLVVPYPAGGGADGIARTIGEDLSKNLGVPLVIDNRPGGSSTIGLKAVAEARPDGYTIGLVNMAFTANPSLIKNMPFDTVKDFTPVGMVAKIPLVVAINPTVQANSLQELIDLSKKSKNGIFYGSAGNGTSNHLIVERLKKITGANLVHVPYRGGAPSVVGLVGNEVSMVMVSPSSAMAFFQSKRLIPLAVGVDEKVLNLEQVPPISRFIPDFEAIDYYGIVAPGNLPSDIRSKLNQAIFATLKNEKVKSNLRVNGNIPFPSTPEYFSEFLKSEISTWSTVISEVGITSD